MSDVLYLEYKIQNKMIIENSKQLIIGGTYIIKKLSKDCAHKHREEKYINKPVICIATYGAFQFNDGVHAFLFGFEVEKIA